MSRHKEAATLRRRAEERLAELRERDATGGRVATPQLTEIRVHEIELEMQNQELQAARLELEELLERYTEIFDFAPNGFFHVAIDGRIRACNFAGARLLGRPRGELVGSAFEGFVSPRDRPEFRRFLGVVLTGPGGEDSTSGSRELAFLPEADLLGRVTGTLLEKGTTRSALLAVEDVTARRRAEHAIREESRKKDEFLAALSHELRNPLTPIRNAVSLYRLVPRDSEKASAAVSVIDRQAAHLARIVDDLLDVTRIARGKIQVRRERLDLGDVVRGTVEDYRTGFGEKGVRLQCEIPAAPCRVQGDASRLAQVLGNLLGNALKFTDTGGRVDVGLRSEGGSAVLRVRDSGVGISPTMAERVFEPFVQGEQTLARSQGGLGLGLAMVKAIVELHRGCVGVASEGPGRGAEFTVRLPLTGPEDATGTGSESTTPSPLRVLVIEDEPEAADSLKDLLEALGHEVRVASEGSSGMLAARTFRPHVLLCDIALRDMSGPDVARTFRSDDELKSTVLVALTGGARADDVRRATESGFGRHVAKPATLEQLEEALRPGAGVTGSRS